MISEKIEKLNEILSQMENAMVAFSGGVDSTLLLKAAYDVLGENLIAVTALSPIYPEFEIKEAIEFAKKLGVKHLTIDSAVLSNPKIIENPSDRCYWCKKQIFSKLIEIAEDYNIEYILDGSNLDDLKDYRPGSKAVKELGIRSPLKEAEFTKKEIRDFSKELNLPTWDKPSLACLASRIPYGTKIRKEDLEMIDRAEEFIRSLGIKNVRVRHHGQIARIEIPIDFFITILDNKVRKKIVTKLKEIGFHYVSVDIEGYRTGSMNETL